MDNVLFNPVMCTSATFEQQSPKDGFVYFVTDTKQIHVVRDGKFVELCGGLNLVYGKKEIQYTNNGKDPDPKVLFFKSDLEDQDNTPLVNDLILNKDGCFYRVTSITSAGFQTERLTLQGTGGTGSGSGSSGSSAGSFGLNAETDYVFPSTATKMEVKFQANYESTNTVANYIAKVTFTIDGESQPFYTKSNLYLAMNETHYIDLYAYKSLFGAATKSVILKVYDKYGTEREEYLDIRVVTLQLVTGVDELKQVKTASFDYQYTLNGAEALSDRMIVYEFYGDASSETPVKTLKKEAEQGSKRTHSLTINDLQSGAYTLKVYAAGSIGGQSLVSNALTHTIVYFSEDAAGTVLGVLMPSTFEQYTDISFKFLIVSDSTDTQTISMSINGSTQDTIEATPGVIGEFVAYFDTANDYTISFMTSSGVTKTYNIRVTAYEGELPIINPSDGRLMLYLTPRGRTNDSVNRDVWSDSSLAGAAAHSQGNGKLTGLYYGSANGWLREEDGTPYLKLTSGAKFEMSDFCPFKFDPTVENTTSSDWQAIKMGSGLTFEIDVKLSGITNYDSNIIECIGLGNNQKPCVGFKMTGKTVRMLNSRLNGVNVITDDEGNVLENTILPLTIIEDQRMRISYVIEPKKGNEFPMCLVYINGVLSGATIYSTGDAYVDVASPATLKIQSAGSEVSVYGIRIYSTALEASDILNNYTASFATLADREAAYKDNNVFNAISGKVDLDRISDKTYDIQIPYMILTGGYPTTKNDKWLLEKNISDEDVHLPTGKKDYRMVDIEIHYPETDYFKTGLGAGLAGLTKKYTNTFANGLGMKDNLGNSSTTGYIMYGQGTSSMEYPVKNLRLRANKKTGAEQFQVRPEIGDLEIVCMKADYMDSSGSHNTGTANLVDDCYAALGIQTPGQKHFDSNGTGSIVTCIKGYPCLIFYSKDGEEYEYVGKYNMNLDKATPEPFGFKNDDDFGYLPEGYQYREGDSDEWKTVQSGEKVNAIHCFEFLDNATEVCNFLGKKKSDAGDSYNYEETWYNKFSVDEGDPQYGWTLGFESRYPEDLTGKHDADALYPLASWIYKLYQKRLEEEGNKLTPEDKTTIYEYGLATGEHDSTKQYYVKESDGTYEKAYPNEEQYNNNKDGKYFVVTDSNTTFAMTSLQEFKDNYEKYLNKEFLLTYYVLTEALLMVDSRVKNMMLATWGPEDKNGNYIFYPIFYDMDTMLGLDNAGKERFTYYDEDTNSNIYNGDCVLWNFVRDALSTEINTWYNKMETAGILVADNILDYYNEYQANMANEAFYNGDAQYKYIEPAIEGYKDDLNGKDIAPGAAPYLYAAQGDRNMNREYFIDNRIPFLRGKHVSEGFRTQQVAEFRWNYPVDSGANSTLDKSIKAVPPDGEFNFTSMQTCYAGVMLGKNASGVQSHKFVGKETYKLVVPNASSANGTEAYLLGVNGLKDIGDLSSKYVQKFVFADSKNIKLENITLGSSKQGYNNTFWKGAEAISLVGCTYLKRFDLRNCPYYTSTIDFTSCPAIETILLTGSGTSGITLPTNGSLKELRLPATMSNLTINSHSGLKTFSMGTYSYETDNLTEEMTNTGRYVEDYTLLSDVFITDTPIDTYKILRAAPNLNDFSIQGFTWEISENDTQYIRTTDKTADANKVYYSWDDSAKEYKSYEKGKWPTKIEDGEEKDLEQVFVLEKTDLVDEDGAITKIPLLDKLIRLRDGKNDITNKLNGTILVNVDAKVNEYAIYNKYHGILPNVTFKYGDKATVTAAHRLKFYNLDKFPTKEEIEAGTLNTFYEVPFDSELPEADRKLSKLVSASGPNGVAIKDPTKFPTSTTTYKYAGSWQMQALKDYDASSEGTKTSLGDEVMDGDYIFIPNYTESVRQYPVVFYDYNGANPTTVNYTYRQVYIDNEDTPLIAYKPDSDLDEDMRWQFKGWISEGDYNTYKNQGYLNNPTYIDMEQGTVEVEGISLYPYFEQEDCTLVASPSKWFSVTDNRLVSITYSSYASGVGIKAVDFQYTLASGEVELNFSSKYVKWISGKITIPSLYEGKVVKAFRGRGGTITSNSKDLNVTAAYFLTSSECEYLTDYAFYAYPALSKVVLPKCLIGIGQQVFSGSSGIAKLENYSDNQNIRYIGSNAFSSASAPAELPSGLEGLGSSAFVNCSIINNGYISEIPIGLRVIGPYTFQGTRVSIWTLGNNGEGLTGYENGLIALGDSAFRGSTWKPSDSGHLYINKSIEYISESSASDPETAAFYTAFAGMSFEVKSRCSKVQDVEDLTGKYAGNNLSGKITSFEYITD